MYLNPIDTFFQKKIPGQKISIFSGGESIFNELFTDYEEYCRIVLHNKAHKQNIPLRVDL